MNIIRGAGTAVVIAACIACGDKGKEVPPMEAQSITPPVTQATPERVQGCLRAGEAANTFVLNASATDTRMATGTTYELLGKPEGLQPHVGRRVEVSGTVLSEQIARSQGATMPAEDRAKGTAGTPTVQSTTRVDIKRLQVTSVTPLGDCDDR